MGRISDRIASIAESATLAVDAKAKALQQAGEDVVGFGAGEPDFPTPQHIVDAAAAACANPRYHKYTPTPGLPELRAAVAARATAATGQDVAASQVLVTNGAKQAVGQAFATLLDPSDEVLVPAPFWVTYTEAIRLTGATPVEVWAGPDRDFTPTVEDLEAARTPRTKALLLNSPNNPTGAVFPPAELERIGRWAVDHDIFVVTDEIYAFLTYDGVQAPSIRALVPDLGDRCIVIDGVSKTYAMTGWRVGWMIGPPDVIAAATNLQSHLTSNVDNVAQVAALAALEGDLAAAEEMRDAFDRRRRTAVKMLGEIPGVECVEPKGAFYVFPSVEGLYGRRIGDRTPGSAMEVAEALLEAARVAVVPGEAFGAPGFVRLSYALSDDALEEGLRRFASVVG